MAILGNKNSGQEAESIPSPLTDIDDYSLPPSPPITTTPLTSGLDTPQNIVVINTTFDHSKNKTYDAPREEDKINRRENFEWTEKERLKAVQGLYASSLSDLENKVCFNVIVNILILTML